jgi:hypothetical protein
MHYEGGENDENNENLHDLYSSLNIITTVKLKVVKCIQGFSGKTCRNGATWKAQAYMRGYY